MSKKLDVYEGTGKLTIYVVMTLQMVYLPNVTNKINLTELMINPETIEFMRINILFLRLH